MAERTEQQEAESLALFLEVLAKPGLPDLYTVDNPPPETITYSVITKQLEDGTCREYKVEVK